MLKIDKGTHLKVYRPKYNTHKSSLILCSIVLSIISSACFAGISGPSTSSTGEYGISWSVGSQYQYAELFLNDQKVVNVGPTETRQFTQTTSGDYKHSVRGCRMVWAGNGMVPKCDGSYLSIIVKVTLGSPRDQADCTIDEVQGSYVYEYDDLGRLKCVIDPVGVLTEYKYDAADNRLEKITYD